MQCEIASKDSLNVKKEEEFNPFYFSSCYFTVYSMTLGFFFGTVIRSDSLI
jgi:hypothetical protein